MAEKVFDYEILHRCQFELSDSHNVSFDCGEPATHRVWWSDGASDAMFVCWLHFEYIRSTELRETLMLEGDK